MTASAILNKPSTAAEHYWAARALTAESILEAKVDHQQELKSLKLYEDEKRMVSLYTFAPVFRIPMRRGASCLVQRDLAVLQQAHDAQHRELKRTLVRAVVIVSEFTHSHVTIRSYSLSLAQWFCSRSSSIFS